MKRCLLLALILFASASAGDGFPTYYAIADQAQAQDEARARQLPLAWVGGYGGDLDINDPDAGSPPDMEQMAVKTLQGNAVVIFFDGHNMSVVPGFVHAQIHIHDDPNLGKFDWLVPKIIFTNPGMTKALGRVSATQMHAFRAAAIYPALQAIRDNPTALADPPPRPKTVLAQPAESNNDSDSGDADADPAQGFQTRFGRLPLPPDLVAFLNQNREKMKPVGIGLFVLLVLMIWLRRRRA